MKNYFDRIKKMLFCLSIFFLIVFCMSIFGLIYSLCGSRYYDTTSNSSNSASAEIQVSASNDNLIVLPGYEYLNLIANTTAQSLSLPNPEQNHCQMRISLILSSGELIWMSELVQPGTSSDPIVLTKKLSEGIYDGVTLKYDCFTTDANMLPLNGGEMLLSLKVHG